MRRCAETRRPRLRTQAYISRARAGEEGQWRTKGILYRGVVLRGNVGIAPNHGGQAATLLLAVQAQHRLAQRLGDRHLIPHACEGA